jgi:FixJ family two-component response regulator
MGGKPRNHRSGKGRFGLQVQDRLQAAGYHVPTNVMTALADENVRARMLQAGAVGFLYKPFTEQDLANGIQATLEAKEDDSRR